MARNNVFPVYGEAEHACHDCISTQSGWSGGLMGIQFRWDHADGGNCNKKLTVHCRKRVVLTVNLHVDNVGLEGPGTLRGVLKKTPTGRPASVGRFTDTP